MPAKEPDLVIKRGPETSVYSFSPDNPCCASVRSGSLVVFETLDCFGGQIRSENDTFDKVGWEKINPATGPLCVEGAEPGDVLAVELLHITVDSPGYMVTVPGLGGAPKRVRMRTVVVPIKNGLAHLPPDRMFEIHPMVGVIGTAPAEGNVPTGTPGPHGGNLDTKVISEGSTVYLPVFVQGAKLAMGDLHALMGDGEVSVCGVEVTGRVIARVEVKKSVSLPSPVVETPTAYYVIWSEPTLDAAAERVIDLSLDLVCRALDCSAEDAIGLLSARGNLQISQIVDPLKTVRFELPKTIFGSHPLF